MSRVTFTKHLANHVPCATTDMFGDTVRVVLDAVFADNPRVRAYVLDDQGAVRKHVVIFVDGVQIQDRTGLSDPVSEHSEIYIMQALSGG